jgi:hypothetical protein
VRHLKAIGHIGRAFHQLNDHAANGYREHQGPDKNDQPL